MDQKTLNELFLKSIETPPETKEELKNWIYVYLGLDMPDSHLPSEGSNSDPMDAIWTAYSNYKENRGGEEPGYIWLSSRDSMKTLAASILAVIVMIFFNSTICWLASIEPQSKIALKNINQFFTKLTPYLEIAGKTIQSNNARVLEIVDSNGQRSEIQILVATINSVNGKHVNCVFIDEVDLVKDKRVLDEVQAVASLIGDQFPLKTYFSTRKFSFSRMEDLIQKSDSMGLKILKWNILDVTQYCGITRRLSDEKTEVVYIDPDPPLNHLTPEKYEKLVPAEQKKYQKLKVYPGCVGCKLVSQCKTNLADRPKHNKGLLWKKIDFTINLFKSMSPDMASAQLLCRRPSMAGLVYPRFDENENTLTVAKAYEELTGQAKLDITFDELIQTMKSLEIPFYVGGDWGFTASQAFVVAAIMPGGNFWILESYAIPGLELQDIVSLGLSIKKQYEPKKWFMDTNQPSFRETFKKNGMKTEDFKKDVAAGIEAIRAQILDGASRRRLKLIVHDKNKIMLEGFRKHHFILDSLGNPTENPDDGEAWSDVCDSLRYLGQNLWDPKTGKILVASDNSHIKREEIDYSKINENLMKKEVNKNSIEAGGAPKTKNKNGFKWNI